MQFCSIASGSSGNCIYVGSRNTHLLVDAGISKKRILDGLHSIDLDGEDIDGILITHEHIDHINGLGVMNRKFHIPMYCTKETFEAIKGVASIGKVDYNNFNIIDANDDFDIGDIKIKSISSSHDAVNSCIYRFDCGEKSTAVVTDLGFFDSNIVENLKGLNGIVLEANHDIKMLEVGPYPYALKRRIASTKGHLSNEQSGELLNKIIHPNLEHIYLGHLSKDNNFEELALETVKWEVTCDSTNQYKGSDLNINVAKRDRPCELSEF